MTVHRFMPHTDSCSSVSKRAARSTACPNSRAQQSRCVLCVVTECLQAANRRQHTSKRCTQQKGSGDLHICVLQQPFKAAQPCRTGRTDVLGQGRRRHSQWLPQGSSRSAFASQKCLVNSVNHYMPRCCTHLDFC